jgi:hypothetical protein
MNEPVRVNHKASQPSNGGGYKGLHGSSYPDDDKSSSTGISTNHISHATG